MSQLTGRRIVVYEVYEDGREVQCRNTFTKIRRPVESLRDIWVKSSPLTYEIFIERIQNGEAIVNNNNEWTGGSMSIMVTYEFLANEIACLKKCQRAETIYSAFKGSFEIPKINNPRALRGRRSTSAKTHRDRQSKFRDFLHNLFYDFCSENDSGTKHTVNSHKI